MTTIDSETFGLLLNAYVAHGEWKSWIAAYKMSGEILSEILQVQQQFPQFCHWMGVYIRQDFLFKNIPRSSWPNSLSSNQDKVYLQLLPYYGEITSHRLISIDQGLCGRAIREQREIDAPDVHQFAEHIACSLKTKSELILPLKDPTGFAWAELDCDSNVLNGFSSPELRESLYELQKKLEKIIYTSFPYHLE